MSNINYKYTFFDQANLTHIRGKPTFETLHKLWNVIKEHSKAVYSNLGGGAHGNLGLVLTESQYALISPTFLFNILTRVFSSFRTTRPPTRTPICGSRTPNKCACSVR